MRLLTLQFKNDTSLEGHFVRFDALLKKLKLVGAKLESVGML